MANDTTTTTGTAVPPSEAEETQVSEALATQPGPKAGMTTPQKVAAGVGAAGATGLAAYGVYRLGQHFGWWGKDDGGIVVDDETVPKDSGGTTPSNGGGTKKTRARGNPPNISGDPAGYNTEQWPGPGPIRLAMLSQGYKVRANEQPLNPDDAPNAHVTQLQADWNKVIRGLDRGRVKFPSGASDKKLLDKYRGLLLVDGLMGKKSLNALEIILTNYTKNAIRWTKLTEQTR